MPVFYRFNHKYQPAGTGRSGPVKNMKPAGPVRSEKSLPVPSMVEILTTNSELYFNYNPLQLAKENSSRSFLATRCVHKYLDKQWYGEVNNGGHTRFFIDALVNNKSV